MLLGEQQGDCIDDRSNHIALFETNQTQNNRAGRWTGWREMFSW